jgi:hypothetical protein
MSQCSMSEAGLANMWKYRMLLRRRSSCNMIECYLHRTPLSIRNVSMPSLIPLVTTHVQVSSIISQHKITIMAPRVTEHCTYTYSACVHLLLRLLRVNLCCGRRRVHSTNTNHSLVNIRQAFLSLPSLCSHVEARSVGTQRPGYLAKIGRCVCLHANIPLIWRKFL